MGCAPIGGGGGGGQWPGGVWMSSSGPFVSRKLQIFVEGAAFIIDRVRPQAQGASRGCISSFTAVRGHVVFATFDAFVWTCAVAFRVTVDLASSTLYNSATFVRWFNCDFHVVDVLEVVDVLVIFLRFKVNVE